MNSSRLVSLFLQRRHKKPTALNPELLWLAAAPTWSTLTWWWCAGLWPAACFPTHWASEAEVESAEPKPRAPWEQRDGSQRKNKKTQRQTQNGELTLCTRQECGSETSETLFKATHERARSQEFAQGINTKARRGGSKPRKKIWRMCELTWHWAHAALEEDER